MLQPDRKWSLGSYRYGFNGKENDNEVKGEGNQQDYGMRVYDPRVGKFLSVDPLGYSFSEQSSYAFASDNPIVLIDQEGGAPEYFDPPVKEKTQPKIYVRRKIVVKTDVHHVTPPISPFTLRRWLNGAKKVAEVTSVVASVLESANSDYAGAGASDGKERKYPNDLEYVTTDPSLLSDDYLEEVRNRILIGTASDQERLYSKELERRGIIATGGKDLRRQRSEAFFLESGKPNESLTRFFNAIDFSKPVTIETLKKGSYVWRFERIGDAEGEKHFFTDGFGADMGDQYGAAAVGMRSDNYKLFKYQVLKDTKVLKSTINQTAVRGVTQYFRTELQGNIKKVEE
jgi:RHS repeat-associated protein